MVISKYVDDLFQHQMPPVLLFFFFSFVYFCFICLTLLYSPEAVASCLLPLGACPVSLSCTNVSVSHSLDLEFRLTRFIRAVYVIQVHAFCP